MPTSARKAPVEPEQPSAKYSPIVKKAFYGVVSPSKKYRSANHMNLNLVYIVCTFFVKIIGGGSTTYSQS